jgi:hypothetical protein
MKKILNLIVNFILQNIQRFDHTLGNALGAFLLMEASSPIEPGNKALFESNLFFPTPSYGVCLDFWYHMWGTGMGTLNGDLIFYFYIL